MELIRGVRPMTGQDIEQVADLEQVCFSESWSENLIRMGLDSRLDTYFVYADHGTILGYAVLRILADEGEIQRIGVYPHYRRQGIARKLMDAMVTFARARGVRAIALEVRESNRAAIGLYEKLGFRPVGRRKNYYTEVHEDAILMTLEWNEHRA